MPHEPAPTRRPSASAGNAPNWVGLRTLYAKEVWRFIKVWTQTILAPVATTLLFFAVFALALGGDARAAVDGVPFLLFLAPGLVVMAMTQNAFANTSSSIVIAKVQGNIVDVLMPPLSPLELTVGFVGGGITRGVAVGIVTALTVALFVPMPVAHPWAVLYFGVMASAALALLGVVGGIWSEKFDHIAAVTNFIVTPAAFLSGTFYSIERLPEPWLTVAYANPFFYMIDGFRYGFIGRTDADPVVGAVVLLALNAVLFWAALRMIATGYKLKA